MTVVRRFCGGLFLRLLHGPELTRASRAEIRRTPVVRGQSHVEAIRRKIPDHTCRYQAARRCRERGASVCYHGPASFRFPTRRGECEQEAAGESRRSRASTTRPGPPSPTYALYAIILQTGFPVADETFSQTHSSRRSRPG